MNLRHQLEPFKNIWTGTIDNRGTMWRNKKLKLLTGLLGRCKHPQFYLHGSESVTIWLHRRGCFPSCYSDWAALVNPCYAERRSPDPGFHQLKYFFPVHLARTKRKILWQAGMCQQDKDLPNPCINLLQKKEDGCMEEDNGSNANPSLSSAVGGCT